MTELGDGMDLPFEPLPPGQTLSDLFAVSGGVVVMASTVMLGGEHKPALIFRFNAPSGRFHSPVLLVMEDVQMGKLPALITQATDAARKAARAAMS